MDDGTVEEEASLHWGRQKLFLVIVAAFFLKNHYAIASVSVVAFTFAGI